MEQPAAFCYENFWKDKYPQAIANEVDVQAYQSVLHVFEEACHKYAQNPAFSNMGKTITYQDLDELSKQFASYLQSIPGLDKGDRIAVQLPNILQYPVVVFGIIRAGFVVVNTNPLYTPREMKHQFNDADVKVLICLSNKAHAIEELLPDTSIKKVIITDVGDLLSPYKGFFVNLFLRYIKRAVQPYSIVSSISFKQALKEGSQRPLDIFTPVADQVAILQYTGGTTGVAKGVVLSHYNLVANMLQAKHFMGVGLKEGEEVVISPLPLYHIYSFTIHCMVVMILGGHNVLITDPRNLKSLVKTIARYPFSVFVGINTLFLSLCRNERFKALDFSHLKLTLSGGMPLQSVTSEQWQVITGCQICEGYGMTETSPVVAANPPLYGWAKTGTIGFPLPSTLCKVVDDMGNTLPVEEAGELCVKGPQVMVGYWNKPDETAKVLDADGWLKTGDIVIIEKNGYMRIVDRKKDMILVSGFNVYPNEIEDVLTAVPEVAMAAAIGVPDVKSGEAIKAFVVLKEGASITEQQLMEHLRHNLTGYKRPKYIEFRMSLPLSDVGKLLRKTLREEELKKNK